MSPAFLFRREYHFISALSFLTLKWQVAAETHGPDGTLQRGRAPADQGEDGPHQPGE